MRKFKTKEAMMKVASFLMAQGKTVSYRPATECVDGFIGWILFF